MLRTATGVKEKGIRVIGYRLMLVMDGDIIRVEEELRRSYHSGSDPRGSAWRAVLPHWGHFRALMCLGILGMSYAKSYKYV